MFVSGMKFTAVINRYIAILVRNMSDENVLQLGIGTICISLCIFVSINSNHQYVSASSIYVR